MELRIRKVGNRMNELLVTIITVVYNGEEHISDTIQSVLNQTYENIEYIIIDGCSSDRTLEIAQSYIDEFEKCKGKTLTIVSEKDNGMYDALNKGISLANGELIGNINADDWYEPQAVEKMVALYNKEKYDVAWSDLNMINKDQIIRKRAFVGKIWTTLGFCHPSMFAKKSVLLAFPYACNDIDDDFDFITRVYLNNYKISILNDVIANYRLGGMSTQRNLKENLKRARMKYNTYRRNNMSKLYFFYCYLIELIKYVVIK